MSKAGRNTATNLANERRKVGIGWQKLQEVIDPAGNMSDNLGASSGFDGATRRFIPGAQGYANASGKAIFGKVN